jgi:hypothetical protein
MHIVSGLQIVELQKFDLLSTVNGQERLVTYTEWSDLIQASFEKCYYVPLGKALSSV